MMPTPILGLPDHTHPHDPGKGHEPVSPVATGATLAQCKALGKAIQRAKSDPVFKGRLQSNAAGAVNGHSPGTNILRQEVIQLLGLPLTVSDADIATVIEIRLGTTGPVTDHEGRMCGCD